MITACVSSKKGWKCHQKWRLIPSRRKNQNCLKIVSNWSSSLVSSLASSWWRRLNLFYYDLILEYSLVQSLASPAYLHYLATNTTEDGQSLLLDSKFKAFLRYLQATWTRPEYSRFLTYPHSIYFLDLLISNDAFCRELSQVSFRNFCHQQQ